MAEIIDPHRGAIQQLASQHKARRVRVFGSVARSAAGPKSDIDFLVDFDLDASAYDQVELMLDLQELLRRKVDLTSESALHWYIRPQAIIEALPV
jgi:predicted nucleotidyltransferase